MKKISAPLLSGILIGMFVIGWMFQQSISASSEAHVRTIERFRELKQLDAQINDYVFKLRLGFMRNYDPLVQTQQDIHTLLTELQQNSPQYFTDDSAPLKTEFSLHLQQREQRDALLEAFKSHHAVLNNSLHYVPILVHDLIKQEKGLTDRRINLRQLMEAVLTYDLTPSDEGKQHLLHALAKLEQGNTRHPLFHVLFEHVKVILDHKAELESQMLQLTQAPKNAGIDALFDAYNQIYLHEEETASRFEQLLILLVVILVAYVGWTLQRLSQTSTELKSSLDELEFQKFAIDQHAIVSISDPQGRIIYTNSKFSEVSQYSREELLGQDHRILNSGYHPSAFFKEMWQTIGRGKVWHAEVRNRRKDGQFYWVDSTVVPFMDKHGKPLRYVSIRTDITHRKSTEHIVAEQRAFYERITETLGEGLYVQDSHGRCSYMNSEAERLLGWSRDEFIGMPVHNTIHTQTADGTPLAAADCPIMKMTLTGQRMHSEDQVFVRKDGSVFPVAVISQGIFHEGVFQGAVVAFQDITLRKETEAQMLLAKEAAEAANRAKSDFLANMSHEIRTPMNGIIGMTDLALDTELDPEQKEYLGMVKTSADALLNIVNDILDFSKIEAGKMVLESIEFRLPDLLSQAARTIAIRAHQKGLELLLDIDPDIPEVLIGDPGRLRQVVLNLISNAIKFTHQGEITLRVCTQAQQPDADRIALRLSVHDTGIGIPADKFQTIFESFSQADTTTTRKYGGTGLGLTICTRFVELMGGRIWLESELGQGTTFYVDLSLPIAQAAQQFHYASDSLSQKRVLVVDDNPAQRQIISTLLQHWGMQSHVVASGAEALAALQHTPPYDLLLLDAQMPDMDGFATLQQLQAMSLKRPSTVMMLTSDRQREQNQHCRALGVSAFLLKPFSQSDLFDTLMNMLGVVDLPASDKTSSDTTRHNQRALRILLAEDNRINQTLACRLLEKFGHQVVVAENGSIALEQWRAGGFDLILMDVDMPVLNGYGATEQIRALEATHGGHIPIIGLTANIMQGSREECLAAGMDGYLSKPINTDALWAELEGVSTRHLPPPDSPDTSSPSLVFDLHKALVALGNDIDLFHEMAKVYLAEYPKYLDQLADAITQQQDEEIRRLGHTIKGMVLIFAVDGLAELAKQIEKRSTPNLSATFDELKQGLSWLAEEVQHV